ncbi:MAG: ATP-dependent helicase [Anaerolineales bacterium]
MTRVTLAGPGTGKTQDLTDQINAWIAGGMNPYSILAITFSRRGAGLITERTGGRVEGHTFHGFANWLIRLECSMRGEEPPEILVDRDPLVELAIEQVDHDFLEKEEVKQALDRIRVLNVPESAIRPQVLEAAERYLALLDRRGLMDFTRILERGGWELRNPQVRSRLEHLYEAVLIDEAQDCNPYLEFPLIEPFLDVLEIYSSPSQQIYTFRGADWEQLSNLLPEEMAIRTLRKNYRSTPEIVRSSSHLAGPDAVGMIPTRDSLGIPVKIYKSPRESTDRTVHTLSSIVREWEGKGIDPGQMAILTRSSDHADLKRGLTHYEVPLAAGSFFASEVVCGALSHLQLALFPTDLRSLDSAMGFPGPPLGMMTRSLLGGERVSWDELIWLISDDQFARRERQKALRMFRRHAHYQTALRKHGDQRNEEVVRGLLAPLRDTLLREGWFQAAGEIEELVSLSGEFDTLVGFVDYLRGEVERVRYTEEGVTLSTIHKSKGMEYQGVIIPGWVDGRIPVDSDDPQTEQNLAYVGLTRARDRLALTVPGAPPSPFLRGMRETSVVHV